MENKGIMKARLIIITSFVLGVFLLSGCGGKKTISDLEKEAKEIQQIEKRSENISNATEAFKLLRDLNQSMKDVREVVLAMDSKYRNASDAEKQKMTNDFDKVNKKIDKSLSAINSNIEPYEDDEKVTNMLNKLNDILISR